MIRYFTTFAMETLRSGEMSLLGLTVPGNTRIQVFSTGSFSSCWYSDTVPS